MATEFQSQTDVTTTSETTIFTSTANLNYRGTVSVCNRNAAPVTVSLRVMLGTATAANSQYRWNSLIIGANETISESINIPANAAVSSIKVTSNTANLSVHYSGQQY